MLQINRINKLPKDVADKIAAGEVVDRPVSIVKELLENSIDSGADSIVVEIKNGGKSYIRVTDNGCGIPKEDLVLAFERHATSKIRNADDLNSIYTLGFRGEALSSISAVSRVEVVTKTAEEKFGSRIKIEGCQVSEHGDTGCPDGTTVIVSDLFYNTPARHKFLKQDSSESSLIIDFVSKMALAYPEIRIRLINNGSILFSTTGKGSIYDNILTIYSKEIGGKLIHLNESSGDYMIEAFISPLNMSKTNRKYQIFFVNGRYITSKVLDNAVTEAYRERMPSGRYPVVFMFIKIVSERLDVNIHPNKREIRFDNNEEVSAFIINSLRKGLLQDEAVPEIKRDNIFKIKSSAPKTGITDEITEYREISKDNEILEIRRNKLEQIDIINLLSNKREAITKNIEENQNKTIYTAEADSEYYTATGKSLPDSFKKTVDFSMITVIGSIFGTYITGVDEDNFYLIDQHAAHERVFYEKMLAQFESAEKISQILLAPFISETTFDAANQSNYIIGQLTSFGYVLEEFGSKSFIIKEIPAFMELQEAKDFINYFLDHIDENTTGPDPKKLNKFITNACKSAVKANRRLDIKEMEQLIKDLAGTKNPFTCPHGRPTFIKMTKYEIEKMFKRV